MPPAGLHELSRAIGALEAGVANLTKKVDEEAIDASRHRQALRETIAALSEAVRALTAEVSNMKPVVEDYRQRASERKGREKLGRWLMALWMAVAGMTTSVVTWALSHWKGILIVSAIGAALVVPALAHSWYPPSCCSDRDCAPLDSSRVKVVPGGYLIDGRELVPYDKAQWSPDENYHGCFPSTMLGKIGCFWAPQRGM